MYGEETNKFSASIYKTHKNGTDIYINATKRTNVREFYCILFSEWYIMDVYRQSVLQLRPQPKNKRKNGSIKTGSKITPN